MIKTTGFFFAGKVYSNKGLRSAAQKRAAAQIIAGYTPNFKIKSDREASQDAETYCIKAVKRLGVGGVGKWMGWAILKCYEAAAPIAAENAAAAAAVAAAAEKQAQAKKVLEAKKQLQWEKERQKNLRNAKMLAGSWKK